MNAPSVNKDKHGTPVQLYMWLLAAFWTAAVAVSLVWGIHHQKIETQQMALSTAGVAFEKDIVYRRWSAGHGGVYAPVTDETPPNPYLAHLPERDITTPSGRKLTLINPAYMTRQVHELEEKQYGAKGHITSLNPLRPENRPDAWEAEALKAFERGVSEVSSVEDMDGQAYMRLMRPLYTEQGCLKCHGQQGYKLGDLRGGIAVSLPMAPMRAVTASYVRTLYVGHGGLWLAGLIGIVVGMRHARRNVRQRDQAEESLRAALATNETVLEAMPVGVIIVGRDKRILRANQAALRLMGDCSQEQVVGCICHENICPSLEGQCPIWDCGEIVENAERVLLGCGGKSVPILKTVRRVTLNGEEVLLEAFVDITERRRAQEQLERTHTQLLHAQKLESIGQLAAGIAHEINTPTQYVGDNTRFLRDGVNDLLKALDQCEELVNPASTPSGWEERATRFKAALEELDVEFLREEIPKAVEQSLEGLERVTRIVRAMKDFSHPGAEGKEVVDLNKAIESTITVARNEWKYVAEMVTDFDPDLPPVPCLVGEFNQVILNIVVNAAHAIADVVGKDTGEKGTITIATRRDGDWAEIRISDTGTGIPEEHRSKVFDHFFTTKEVGKGTGQGLAIAHAVVTEKHGGDITLETEMGEGTTFIIRLPIEPESAAAERTPECEEPRSCDTQTAATDPSGVG